MHELFGLGGITVSNFKKGTEKMNAIESGPRDSRHAVIESVMRGAVPLVLQGDGPDELLSRFYHSAAESSTDKGGNSIAKKALEKVSFPYAIEYSQKGPSLALQSEKNA